MHGRVKKDVVEPSPEEKEKQREQVRTARALFAKMLEQRQACVYNQQTFDMTTKALQFHPEFPTLWGFRREILLSGALSGEHKALLEGEMKLLEKALRRTQKVYSIWFHRKWVVERLFQHCGATVADAGRALDTELELCGKLLDVDERNFHCWNHRAYVMGLMRKAASGAPATASAAAGPADSPPAGAVDDPSPGIGADSAAAATAGAGPAAGAPPAPAGVASTQVPAEAPTKDFRPPARVSGETGEGAARADAPDLTAIDLKLSRDLIDRNFSNYSAWHLRALLQQSAGAAATADPVDMAEELEWVQQGIYTEPNDQSVWLYHHWLTTLGRGTAQTRITHCAALKGTGEDQPTELFIFFSEAVSACRDVDTSVRARAAASTGEPVTVLGTLSPLGPDASGSPSPLLRRTRRLPATRRRWLHGWRFVPRPGQPALESLVLEDIAVDTSVEELGSTVDGEPEHSQRRITFAGPCVQCDGAAASPGLAPAMAALLGAPPEAARSELLRGELSKVEELLEIEPDCRWALLARGRMVTAVAAGGCAEAVAASERAVAAGYEQIAALDPLRSGFYAEARGTCELRLRALAWLQQSPDTQLDLTGLGLRHLPPAPVLSVFGVRRLDLTGAGLHAFGPLLQLLSLEELIAAKNCLNGDVQEAFCLPRLRRLDVSGNALRLGEQTAAERPESSQDTALEIDVSGNPAIAAVLREKGAEALLSRLSGAWTVDSDVALDSVVLRRRKE